MLGNKGIKWINLILFIIISLIPYSLDAHQLSPKKRAKLAFERGYKEYFRNNLDKAIPCFKTAVRLDPGNPLYRLYLAKSCYKKGWIKNAKTHLNKCLELDPHQREANSLLGKIFFDAKDYEKAEPFYLNLLKNSGEDFEAHYYLGRIYLERGKLDSAIVSFKEASLLNPKNAEVIFLLGKTHLEKGNLKEAINSFNLAIQLEATNPSFYYWRGVAYFRKGDYKEDLDSNWHSAKDFQQALTFGMNTPEVYFMYANSLLKRAIHYINKKRIVDSLNLLKQATILYKKTIALSPNSSNAYNNLGDVYYYLNQLDEAIASYKKAIELEPGIASFHDKLGDAYYKKGDFKKALKEWKLTKEIDPHYRSKLDGVSVTEKIHHAKRLIEGR